MRISKLRLQNLGPHADTRLELDPVNVFVGPNGAGKSFILDAFHVMRFGQARGIQANEALLLATEGTKGWGVDLEVLDKAGAARPYRRTRTAGPTVGELDFALGDPRRFAAIYEATSFLDMKPSARKELAAACFGADSGEVLRQLDEIVPFPEDHPLKVAVRAGNLRRAHALAEEVRLAKQRELRALEASAAAGVVDVEVETKKGKVLVSTIAFETARDAMEKARTSLADGRALDRRLAEIDGLRIEAEAAQTALEGLKAEAGWTDAEEKDLRQAIREAEGAAQMKTAAAERRNARKESELQLREILKHADAGCPTCGAKVTKERKVMLDAEVERLAREAQEAHADCQREEKAEREHRARAAELEKKHSGARSVSSKVKALETTIATYTRAKEAASGPRPDLPALEATVMRLARIYEARVAYESSTKNIAGAQEKIATKASELALCEKVSEAVKPDGVGDEAGVLAFLNSSVAQYAKDLFPEGSKPPVVGADWNATVLGRWPGLASRSERIRAGICFAIALSVGAGPGLVLLDNAESLEPVWLNALIDLLSRLASQGEIHTALVTRVQSKANRPASSPQGVRWFHVEAGTAKEV